ncbi:MAG: helix-turn-helix transcriptional regulator [Kiritimatiellae bacterium]|nr:helix-turn-helix transcriptional regulator [Kiritimatiellia bacterium]
MRKSLSQILGAFIDASANVESTGALCKQFEQFLDTLGFSGFFYTAIPGIPKREPNQAMFLEKVLLYATDMKAVRSLMDSEVFGQGPIIVRLFAGAAEPFTGFQAFKEVTGKLPPGRPEEIMEDPSLAYSLICPVDTPDRRCGVTLLSKERGLLKLYRQLWRVKNVAYAGTLLFHERWKTLVHKANEAAVTLREYECLLWAAQGKTASEMAIILNISERTVRFHLTNASEKLDTTNVTHTVALAIAQGLIPAEPFE